MAKFFKRKFLALCKEHGVTPIIGNRWHCNFEKSTIEVPAQNTVENIFFGCHELAHYVLHKGDKRNYDDLFSRIEIEREADRQANDYLDMIVNAAHISNHYTLGLIALHLYQGGIYQDFEIKIEEGRFIILKRMGLEIFSQFINNLPMHPVIY